MQQRIRRNDEIKDSDNSYNQAMLWNERMILSFKYCSTSHSVTYNFY
jgi:hypothetical protein